MDAESEKVYVAVGNDIEDGIRTLAWTLRKWNSNPISVVILHVSDNVFPDFVYTPFGKLPARVVAEEKLEVLNKHEREKIDKLLSNYITFCGQVKCEILKVEKHDEPVQRLILDLISRLQITKLVMGFTFMKSSSWKSKGMIISGSFFIHQHKPDFCEFYIICGGKQVFLRGQKDQEEIMEDEDNQGVTVARMRDKSSLTSWAGRLMFSGQTNPPERNSRSTPTSSSNLEPRSSQIQWEIHVQEIESYFQQLLSSDLDADDPAQENERLEASPEESENTDSTMSPEEKIESLRIKIRQTQQEVELRRKEAKDNIERHAKAERILSLCIPRAEELEAWIKEEVKNRSELEKRLDEEKEHMNEVLTDIEESKKRLSSMIELQTELSNKLQISTLAKSHAEAQLEKAVVTRAEMVREIEELRRQRDVFNRRIEFCREKDAIGMVSKLNGVSCSYREYTSEEIRLATDNFSESKRLKSGGEWTNVYRGRLKHGTVAIKLLSSSCELSDADFQAKVDLLGHLRHPHLVAMIGLCSELKCLVFEYMHSGNLRDILSPSTRSSRTRNNLVLQWHDRINIVTQVCSGLGFLHTARPKPMIHGHLAPSNILLDYHHVAKISGFGLSQAHNDCEKWLDIRAFGAIMLHLLTGRNWADLVEEALTMERAASAQFPDEMVGDWPLGVAEEFAGLATRCLSVNGEPETDLSITRIMEELNKIKNKANDVMERGESEAVMNGGVDEADSCDAPKVFLCPIFQDIMKNPHVAADGFSYELEAIEEWVATGHNTSPMTNLKLKHTQLTPNLTLRSLIQDWQSKRSTTASRPH